MGVFGGMGPAPPSMDRISDSENITFPRTTYVVDNNLHFTHGVNC